MLSLKSTNILALYEFILIVFVADYLPSRGIVESWLFCAELLLPINYMHV